MLSVDRFAQEFAIVRAGRIVDIAVVVINRTACPADAQLYGRIKRFNYGVNVAYQNNHSNNDDYIVNASLSKLPVE